MEKRLGINTFNAIGAIIGAVLTGTMFAWMFSDATVAMYYGSGVIMLITNIIGLAKQKKAHGKLGGNILGIIAAAFHTITGLLAFPAMVLYIIASVFIFKNKIVLEVQ